MLLGAVGPMQTSPVGTLNFKFFSDDEFAKSNFQQYNSTAVQQYNSTAVQQYNSTAVQQYSSTAVQQYSSTAVLMQTSDVGTLNLKLLCDRFAKLSV